MRSFNMEKVRLFVLQDGTQLVSKFRSFKGVRYLKDPCQIIIAPGQEGYRIMLNRYPTRAKLDEELQISCKALITEVTPDSELEDLYRKTVSPLDLSSKMPR